MLVLTNSCEFFFPLLIPQLLVLCQTVRPPVSQDAALGLDFKKFLFHSLFFLQKPPTFEKIVDITKAETIKAGLGVPYSSRKK